MTPTALTEEDDQWARATTLHGAAVEALDAADLALFDSNAEIRATLIAAARGRLTDGSFDRAEPEERAMPISEAAEAAGAVLHGVIDRAG